jgi:hypothetical protein
VPFLRLTRDRRGYENTFLLHAGQPGERPRVLYWYRSAPGVRVGRPALDEDAIRSIEEQHPDIEFDWPHILEVGASSPPEIEQRRPARPRRTTTKASPSPVASIEPADEPAGDDATTTADDADSLRTADEMAEEPEAVAARPHDLLEELVGREIATRLRGRYAEIVARIHQRITPGPQRDHWEKRAAALDPDAWVTADEILGGVSRADQLFDAIRRDLLS